MSGLHVVKCMVGARLRQADCVVAKATMLPNCEHAEKDKKLNELLTKAKAESQTRQAWCPYCRKEFGRHEIHEEIRWKVEEPTAAFPKYLVGLAGLQVGRIAENGALLADEVVLGKTIWEGVAPFTQFVQPITSKDVKEVEEKLRQLDVYRKENFGTYVLCHGD